MAADPDRRLRIISAWTPREHIAHFVDRHRQARFFAPTGKKIPSDLVLITERQTVAAAICGRAYLGHFHDAIPEARSVDANVFGHCFVSSLACSRRLKMRVRLLIL